MMDVLERSKQLIDKVYEQMSMVESCESIAGMVSDLPFVFLDTSEGDHVISLSRVLTDGQIENIRGIIVTAIRSNAEDAAQWLSNLQEPAEQTTKYADGSDAEEDEESDVIEEEDPVPEEVVQEETEEVPLPEPVEEPEIVIPDTMKKKSVATAKKREGALEVDGKYILEQMSAGRKQKEIAEELGISQPVASQAVGKYKREVLAKLDKGKVMALHRAKWTDADIADELGVQGKIIKEVLR